MKTLAIVSSYAESCGNAAFAKILHDSIEKYSDLGVEVIALNLKLLRSIDSKIRHAADAHIQDLCIRIKTFDLVNLQVEQGLYGRLHIDIYKRLKKLIAANPNTNLTLHAPRLIDSDFNFFSILYSISKLHIRTTFAQLISCFRNPVRLNKKIIRYAIKKKCRLIVHTLRAKEQIGMMFNYHNVDVHPLKMVPDDFHPDQDNLEKLKQALTIKEEHVLVGVFGYISANKGHLDAINAITVLPDNYKLLIFGRQHPQTISSDGKMDKYLESLMNMIIKSPSHNLHERVIFVGELSDTEFLHMAANIDLVWLPYYENGQDGSGVASICLDLCPRVLCSASLAFDELFKLIPYEHYLRFDIGNSLEIANKTKMIMQKEKVNLNSIQSSYTIKSQAELYMKELETT